VPQTITRVPDGANGHYAQWVEGAIAGYGKNEMSSPFEIAGPLTESLLMANLAIRGADIRKPKANGKGFDYPGRYIELLWDNANMKVTNLMMLTSLSGVITGKDSILINNEKLKI